MWRAVKWRENPNSSNSRGLTPIKYDELRRKVVEALKAAGFDWLQDVELASQLQIQNWRIYQIVGADPDGKEAFPVLKSSRSGQFAKAIRAFTRQRRHKRGDGCDNSHLLRDENSAHQLEMLVALLDLIGITLVWGCRLPGYRGSPVASPRAISSFSPPLFRRPEPAADSYLFTCC